MAKPLRIEYPGTWYHVMNRGRRGEDVFADSNDYEGFIALLQETSKMFDLRVSAFCLMSNHYHLLQTPSGNLSRAMRHVNGVYTQRYNRRRNIDGQLFRSRYKSVLVQEDSHLLELLRYIHRNPVTAHMCNAVGDYPWSSHQEYISAAKKKEEIPQSKGLEPTIVEIKQAVCQCYKIREKELEQSNRGKINELRNAAVYLARKRSGLRLEEIGREFGIKKYSSVSSIVS